MPFFMIQHVNTLYLQVDLFKLHCIVANALYTSHLMNHTHIVLSTE